MRGYALFCERIAHQTGSLSSRKGLSARTQRDRGEKCHVTILLSGTSSELKVNMAGEVIRNTEDGIGIYFDEIDIDSFYHLKNIVYYNTDHPDRIVEPYLENIPDGTYVDD